MPGSELSRNAVQPSSLGGWTPCRRETEDTEGACLDVSSALVGLGVAVLALDDPLLEKTCEPLAPDGGGRAPVLAVMKEVGREPLRPVARLERVADAREARANVRDDALEPGRLALGDPVGLRLDLDL